MYIGKYTIYIRLIIASYNMSNYMEHPFFLLKKLADILHTTTIV